MENILKQLTAKTDSPQQLLKNAINLLGNDLLMASSLGAEDQVLTHMMSQLTPNPRIFVLDTGRLHQETYDVLQETMTRYKLKHEVYFPKTSDIESMVREKGPNSFYQSIENRKQCCYIRKVEPLNRALGTCKAWITGLRKEQSSTRDQLKMVSWDDAHKIIKINPLVNWTEKDVWDYIKTHKVPYNKLHDANFPSIGCAPCTRAIKEGEDTRAGRWWWEDPGTKECGLHIVDGKMVRKEPEKTNNKDKEVFL
jgi:phosphoadenosine phosphosulfate reductase